MKPILVNGQLWKIEPTSPGSFDLVDRTGLTRLATTDPSSKTIYVSESITPPLLDNVIIHEIAHAITVSYGLLDYLRERIPRGSWVSAEEWAANLMEHHAIEAAELAGMALGRRVCVSGFCH